MAIIKFNQPTQSALSPLLGSSLLSPFFSDVFESVFNEPSYSGRLIARVPAVNIGETDKEYQIEVAAPGMKKDDFKVSLDDDLLTISVEKTTEGQEEKTYNKCEFNYNSFVRTFTLPESADQTKIEGEYTDGILRIKVKKTETAKKQTRAISIK